MESPHSANRNMKFPGFVEDLNNKIPPLFGYTVDRLGSYTQAWDMLVLSWLVALFILIFLCRKKAFKKLQSHNRKFEGNIIWVLTMVVRYPSTIPGARSCGIFSQMSLAFRAGWTWTKITRRRNLLYSDYQTREENKSMPELASIPRSARVTTRGQLTIPQDIQGALDLDKRVSVNLFRVEKVLLITPVDFPSEPRSCIWAKTKAKFKSEGGQVKVVRAKGC